MASKWRELTIFRNNYAGRWELDTVSQMNMAKVTDGKDIELVDKAALDEALELIGELEKALKGIENIAELHQATFRLMPSHMQQMRDWFPILNGIAKIKAFKDRMNESTTTDKGMK